MSNPAIDVLELAREYFALREAYRNEETFDRLFHENTEMVIPGMFSSDTLKGRSKILKQWHADDKDLKDGTVTVKQKENDWKLLKPLVAYRSMRVKKYVFTVDIGFTLHFNASGKIDKAIFKKL
eukprot:TRINITY_DN13188_c0_g1_i1.p1 TRINITY_DN13188_c0_g1~~TRINITY_DN13188_c0_g1_i1.p1  ORF type:complete len:124 (+),score=41.90 TRINITY_DN13188_c0_g1_i1:54-425(+)